MPTAIIVLLVFGPLEVHLGLRVCAAVSGSLWFPALGCALVVYPHAVHALAAVVLFLAGYPTPALPCDLGLGALVVPCYNSFVRGTAAL
jgi:hypothetical protein